MSNFWDKSIHTHKSTKICIEYSIKTQKKKQKFCHHTLIFSSSHITSLIILLLMLHYDDKEREGSKIIIISVKYDILTKYWLKIFILVTIVVKKCLIIVFQKGGLQEPNTV